MKAYAIIGLLVLLAFFGLAAYYYTKDLVDDISKKRMPQPYTVVFFAGSGIMLGFFLHDFVSLIF